MKNPTTFITKDGVSDADLIAATRDMYEALAELLDIAEQGAPLDEWVAASKAARAAIAKARGLS